ncbi:hypothetical protein NC651_019675 [Populus alba x Populus x berolinensis]|nr:hypothetical protein NC651_019675 [Populus alba x Populus x berolinensis]
MSPSLTPSHDVTIISCLHEAASSPTTCPLCRQSINPPLLRPAHAVP